MKSNPFANKLRKNPPDAERQLWMRLRNRQVAGHKFRRQHPIPPYIVDFVCIEKQLIVELDGGQHLELATKDEARTRFLSKGYRVIRFWDNEVLTQTDAVLETILVQIEHPSPCPLPTRRWAKPRLRLSSRAGRGLKRQRIQRMSIKQLFDLTGRTALITGGSRGLGLQMAEAFGEMGAKVALTARKANELEEAQAHLKKIGIEAMIVASDISQPSAVEPLIDQVLARFGGIDILVNNAGAAWGARAEDHPLDAWQKVINLNLTAVFTLSQAVGKRLMIPKRKGKIINIASIAGLVGTDPRWMPTIAYNTSKGGVVNFTRSLAAEWAEYNINVNAIAPGVFPSKMSKDMIEHGEEMIINAIPMRRLGGPEELKGVAVLLASDASDYITGQTIAVDGGFVSI